MTVESSGEVGIGTTDPAEKLHVAGNVAVGGQSTLGASSAFNGCAIPLSVYYDGSNSNTNTYQEVISVRHTAKDSDAELRRLGIAFSLSNEGSSNESNKMGAITVESSDANANGPDMYFWTANTKKMVVTNDGLVGIGTATPTAMLTMYGDQPRITVQNDDDASSYFQLGDNSSSQAIINKISSNSNSLIDINPLPSNTYDAAVRFFRSTNTTGGSKRVEFYNGLGGTTKSAQVGVDGVNSFFQADAGNLGVGTTSPIAILNVHDLDESTTQTNFTQAVSDAGILVTSTYTADAYMPGLFWSTENNNSNKPKGGIYLQTTSSGSKMHIGTSNTYSTGITNSAIVIDKDGKVGIGTASPAYKLQVSGDANITSKLLIGTTVPGDYSGTYELAVQGQIVSQEVIVISSGDWADYVFEDGYKLMAIGEVEEYINQNGHLPNVPSAQEVKDNGISLGQMDATLLRKIEELTLYVIELEKKNTALEAKVSKLETK